MGTKLEINKKSVGEFLASGKNKRFVIPEYQRAYAWETEEVTVLFEDLVEHTESGEKSNYFLGTIVSFVNEDEEQEIIDGQQRTTSLFLLLRAIYTKLSSMTEAKEVKNFKGKIEKCLWTEDEITGDVNFKETLITSRVMNNEGNKVFQNLLITGIPDEGATDNYTKNYMIFQNLIDKYAASEPELFFHLLLNVLDKSIMLPITADSQDSALTIFSTINDRGLALTDSDIFKAKIYNHLNTEEKSTFIEQWQRLDEEAENAQESIQKLFYYYMFYLRALEGDRKTTTPGMRKYFSRDNFKRLYEENLMTDLEKLVSLWVVVNNQIEIEELAWTKEIEILKVLDSLRSYPNEFWKYPVVSYYLKYSEETDFPQLFTNFLKKLFADLSARYIVTPTVNAVKAGILNLNVAIMQSSQPVFKFNEVEIPELKSQLKLPHRFTVRMILKVLAYQKQDKLLPANWEIEHIMPTKWQSSYFPSIPDEEVEKVVEYIGNKIPFEKKLNIIASNGYFQKKKEVYRETDVVSLQELSESHEDWSLDEIRERTLRISDEFISLLQKWGLNDNDYLTNQNEQEDAELDLSEEERALLEKLREKGAIQF